MNDFVYEGRANRVVFGNNRIQSLDDELARLNMTHVMVVASSRQLAAISGIDNFLHGRIAGEFDRIAMHAPRELIQHAVEAGRQLGIDGAVAVGGGSAIGLAKALALELNLPIAAVPTTFSGSEMTPIWGVTEGGKKRTGRDTRVLPRVVIYDPVIVSSLPTAVAASSGMNAIAHCVEALYAVDGNPLTALIAEEGIRALAASLPVLVKSPGDLEATGRALYGAWLAGSALATVTMGLHHKLCHTLGGSFDLPHAETHAIILPHATAYNSDAAPEAMERIAKALGAKVAARGLFDLARHIGAPVALAEVGMLVQDLDRAADLAMQNAYDNPRPVERDTVRKLLDDAYYGRPPS